MITIDDIITVARRAYPDSLLTVKVHSSPGFLPKLAAFCYITLDVNGSLEYSTEEYDNTAEVSFERIYRHLLQQTGDAK